MKRIGLLVLAWSVVSLAAWTPAQVDAASNGLGVNPRRDYVVKSGEKISETLVVTNLSKTDALNIDIKVVDFAAKDQTGSPSLLLGSAEPTRWSLKPYLTIPKTQTIPAGKSAEIPFTVSIPKNVGAGSYYSAIKYAVSGADGEENVTLASSSATLMFVRVPGEARNSLQLQGFGAFTPDERLEKGVYGTFYSATAPKYLSYAFQNKGNVAEQPAGSIILKDSFGKQVLLLEDANPSKNIVLIDQTRRIDLCMNEERSNRKDPESGRNIEETKCNNFSLMPGRYTATMAMMYGDNGSSQQEINAVSSFWYLPVWFLVAAAVLLLLLAAAVWFVVRKLTRRHGGVGRSAFLK